MSVKTAPQSHSVLAQSVMRSAIVAAIIFVIGAFCAAGRRHHAGEILFRRGALRAGGAADAGAGDADADAQPDASAAGKAAHRAVDRVVRRRAAGLALSGVLFGSLAVVAVYLCGLALFAAQGPAIAAALLAFFNQMLFVQSRIAMLDIFALAFSLFAIAAFVHGFRQIAAASLVCARRVSPSAWRSPANGAGCSCSRSASSSLPRSA